MTIKSAGFGRPRVTDRAAVGRAVAAVGFEELTFLGVAQRLGVGVATVHRYARDRDDLVRLGMEHVLASWDWPALEGSWRDLLNSWGHAAWLAWAAHPGAVGEAAMGIVPVAMLTRTIDLAQYLVESGFDPVDAVLAVDLVIDLAADSRRAAEALPGEQVVREAAEVLRSRSGLPATRAVAEAAGGDPREWFARKLEVLLDGIAARQDRPGTSQSQERTRA